MKDLLDELRRLIDEIPVYGTRPFLRIEYSPKNKEWSACVVTYFMSAHGSDLEMVLTELRAQLTRGR
jgi:hypothetical protein